MHVGVGRAPVAAPAGQREVDHAFGTQAHFDGAVGFLTDGFQFYGLAYKTSNLAAALGRPTLPNRNYQYEFALPTLQSRRLSLAPGATGEITFFAAFEVVRSDSSASWAPNR